MTPDIIDALAALNPAPTPPEVESVERVLATIHEAPRAASWAERRRWLTRRQSIVGGSSILLAACAVGLVLAGGSSGPGVNVAAAAYAATSTGSGIVEAEFVEHLFSAGRPTVKFHDREWIDTTTESRREQRLLPTAIRHHGQPVTFETASTPGWVEVWNGAGTSNAIYRFRDRPNALGIPPSSPETKSPATTPQLLLAQRQAIEGVTLYRRLYQQRSVKLVGRVRLYGRILWKLEGDNGWAFHSLRTHGKFEPISRIIVFVDPRTYLPVIERQINLIVPGHPVQAETQLLSYRRLPATTATEALLKLSTQHPNAQLVTTSGFIAGQGGHYRRLPATENGTT